ncbi:MAG: DUF3322 domain-containing protein [Austwickia sp.]|nr:hypothetical protein [Austwickia sp.]MCO5307848.1 DUF3322 domain-containing protein [Austwickia sp.]
MPDWTTVADLRAAVRRRWTNGSLLTAYATGQPFPPLSLPIRGPRASDIGARFDKARRWRDALVRTGAGGAAYGLVEKPVGGRIGGRNSLPDRAVLDDYDQAWRLLGVQREVAAFDEVLQSVRGEAPELLGWIAAHPLRALRAAESWPALLAAYRWLRSPAAAGAWLRQISAPGVDTKFVEKQHTLLAELLIAGGVDPLPVDGSPGGAGTFAQRFGLRVPERLVHLRFGPGFAGLPPVLTEANLRLVELAQLRVETGIVVIVENLQTFQAWPVPAQGVVLWGAGYLAPRLSRLPWARAAPRVVYSGDLDTHGFAILSGLRAGIPQVESLAMDAQTLLAHRDRWGTEPSPTAARLTQLTPAEAELYRDLVEDTYGSRVRLEQERLHWPHVEGCIEAAGLAERGPRPEREA